MNNERRLKTLLESYDVLMNGTFEKNYREIMEIIAKIAKYDTSITIELWKSILNKYPSKLKDEDFSYALTDGVINDLNNAIGEEETVSLLVNNKDIAKKCLYDSIECSCLTGDFIGECLKNRKYEDAILFFDMIMNSPRKIDYSKILSKDEKVYLILERCRGDYFSDEAIEILYMWAEKINDKELKAKINSILISVEEYHDEYKEFYD